MKILTNSRMYRRTWCLVVEGEPGEDCTSWFAARDLESTFCFLVQCSWEQQRALQTPGFQTAHSCAAGAPTPPLLLQLPPPPSLHPSLHHLSRARAPGRCWDLVIKQDRPNSPFIECLQPHREDTLLKFTSKQIKKKYTRFWIESPKDTGI